MTDDEKKEIQKKFVVGVEQLLRKHGLEGAVLTKATDEVRRVARDALGLPKPEPKPDPEPDP